VQGGQLPPTFFSRGGKGYLPLTTTTHPHTFWGSFYNHVNAERQHQYDKRKEVVVCCSPQIFESKFLSKLKVFMEVLPKIKEACENFQASFIA